MNNGVVKTIDQALSSRKGRRTLARAMVKPMFTWRSPVWDRKDCKDCGSYKTCKPASASDRDEDCWRPDGCLLVWDI